MRVLRLGLDSRDAEAGGVERYVLFSVDGPSLIRAQLSNSSGDARVCLWPGNLVQQRECETIRDGSLEHVVLDAGQTTWTLSLIGFDATTAPVLDLTLDFNATAPLVTFENLRFQGVPVANYNGITAEVDASAAGELRVEGTFEIGELHPSRVTITRLGDGGGVVYDQTNAPQNTFVATFAVTEPATFSTTVSNPSESAEPLPVFLEAKFSWP